jgi:hypothetical protein
MSEWNAMSYITKCGFHGQRDNVMAYTTKNASLHYLDMRYGSKINFNSDNTKSALVVGSKQPTEFLKRYLSVMSDFAFLNDAYQVVTRDYLFAKVWDLRKPTECVKRYSVYPSLVSKISELYDEMRLEDQFPLYVTKDGSKILTGSYDCSFHEINLKNVHLTLIQHSNIRYRLTERNQCDTEIVTGVHDMEDFDPDPRVSCLAYNPSGESLCAAVRDSIFVFKNQNGDGNQC